MCSKISVAFVAALAVGAQAWGGHDFRHHMHKNGTYTHPSQPHESGKGPHGGPSSHPGPFPGSPSEAAPSIPLTTGTSGEGSGSGSGSGESGATTLTYTLGSGTSTTVITTTILHTETNVAVRISQSVRLSCES